MTGTSGSMRGRWATSVPAAIRHGCAAPFRRNDELLNLLPKGVIDFPGAGITDSLVDKAKSLGIPVRFAFAHRSRDNK